MIVPREVTVGGAVTVPWTKTGTRLVKVMTLPLVPESLASDTVPLLLNDVNPPPGIIAGVIVVALLLKARGKMVTALLYVPVA